MEPPDTDRIACSRRALLGGVAGLAAAGAAPVAAAAPTLTVLTRNCYTGVDLAGLFDADSMDDVARIAGEMLDAVRSHPYEARADALAAEVEATAPDAVALQEAALIRVQSESDFADAPVPNAEREVVDLLDLLTDRLAARGLDYEVAASTVTTDIEVPADRPDGRADVRLTDRTAVLVRSDADVSGTYADTFDATYEYAFDGVDVPIRRGFCLVDLAVDGADVTVAGAHLASTADDVRREQAGELLDLLPDDRPVALAGDLNSGPGGPRTAYDRLIESFEDAHASVRGDDADGTCCHASDLRNDSADLSRRIDHVLVRGALEPIEAERVGADPGSRASAEVDGETVEVWPSDHAGVVATVAVTAGTPTSTPTESPTATPTATRTDAASGSGSGSGFWVFERLPFLDGLVGVGSFALAAVALYRRDGRP
ncbi:endonuclease/exonuclease/phosphatase family protein [Halomicrobium salinisoli]|uniref:endonuclease/exonuclease/phosphatase family protein n=1 Tax=Halomicrobium salinisoli TaxID=2878391 RepID=UPI001CF03EB8|nr:endonuclease/exonuclease/phosphatase family protein [Halomicrobium salinisoli]